MLYQYQYSPLLDPCFPTKTWREGSLCLGENIATVTIVCPTLKVVIICLPDKCMATTWIFSVCFMECMRTWLDWKIVDTASSYSWVNGFCQWNKAQINAISVLSNLLAELSLPTTCHTCCTWWEFDVLHVICTWLYYGHLRVDVGDSWRCSQEIEKILELRLLMSLLLLSLLLAWQQQQQLEWSAKVSIAGSWQESLSFASRVTAPLTVLVWSQIFFLQLEF